MYASLGLNELTANVASVANDVASTDQNNANPLSRFLKRIQLRQEIDWDWAWPIALNGSNPFRVLITLFVSG